MAPEKFEKVFTDWKRGHVDNTVISRSTETYNALNMAIAELKKMLAAELVTSAAEAMVRPGAKPVA